MIANRELAVAMGAAGRQRAMHHFDIKETVAGIEGVFSEVLGCKAAN
jgi:hypothetical protein